VSSSSLLSGELLSVGGSRGESADGDGHARLSVGPGELGVLAGSEEEVKDVEGAERMD
jgi:hypothetical protein